MILTGKPNLPIRESTIDKLHLLLLPKIAKLPQKVVLDQEFHMSFGPAKSFSTLPVTKIIVKRMQISIFIILYRINPISQILFIRQDSSRGDGISKRS